MTQSPNQTPKPQPNSKVVAIGTAAPSTTKASPSGLSATGLLPKTWADIKPGSLVIAQENLAEGWWEAIVVEVAGDKFTLRWRDYPKFGPFNRSANQVALLHPGS